MAGADMGSGAVSGLLWKGPYFSREILESQADADHLEGLLPKSAMPCRPRPPSYGRASQLGCPALAGYFLVQLEAAAGASTTDSTHSPELLPSGVLALLGFYLKAGFRGGIT